MEAWAAAKWMRTSLHWLTLVPAGLRRTVCEVPEKVPGEEAHVPIRLLSQVAHLQKPGLGLPHSTGLNHAPCFQTLCPLVSQGVGGCGCKDPRKHRCWATQVRVWILACR